MIIDVHIHYGDSVRHNMKPSCQNLLEEMDSNGISKAICAHNEAMWYNMETGNQKTIELMRKYPERILGYCAISSTSLGGSTIPYIRQCVRDLGMVGVKLYSIPYIGKDQIWIPFDNRSFYPVFEELEKLSVPILAHASPREVGEVAKRFQNLKIIMAHSGNAPAIHGQWQQAVYVARRYPNIYLDMSGSTIDIDCLEFALEELGPNRIVYGSDWPAFGFEFSLARFNSVVLSGQDRNAIFSQNARMIFNI